MIRKISFGLIFIIVVMTLFIIGFTSKINNQLFSWLVGAYVFVMILFLVYIIALTFLKTRLLDRQENLRRIKLFIITLIIIITINCVMRLLIKDMGIKWMGALFTSAGASFGVAYWDLMFKK